MSPAVTTAWLYEVVGPDGPRVFLRYGERFWMIDTRKRQPSFSIDASAVRCGYELEGPGVREVDGARWFTDEDLKRPVASWRSTCHPGCGVVATQDAGDGTVSGSEAVRAYLGEDVLSIAEGRV